MKSSTKKLAYMKRHHADHRKERNAYTKKWRAKHARYVTRHNTEYYLSHRERRKEKQRKYHAAHRKQCNVRSNKYYAAHRAEASWRNMHDRCNYPVGRNAAYINVKVCKRWSGEDGLKNFLADMGPCPSGKSLSRLKDRGNYKPSNCAWHTRRQQALEHKKKRGI